MRLKLIKIIIITTLISGVTVPVLNAAEMNSTKINLDVKNMNITDVLRMLAEQGQVNIVASKNVQGRVTAKLQDVTIEQALKAILETNSFTYKIDEGIIKVYTPQDILQQDQIQKLQTKVFGMNNIKANELRQVLNAIKSPRGRIEINLMANQVIATDTPENLTDIEKAINAMDTNQITRIYNLNYANAKDIQAKLQELIPKQEGEVFIDERTNSVIIRAIPQTIEKISPMLGAWDKRSSQVLIEARILEVSLDKTKGLGINWEYQKNGKNSVDLSSTLPVNVSGGGIFKVGTLTEDEYAITIQALESSTNTNILSNPRIVVIDNTEANILVGSAEPYTVTYVNNETKTQTEETKFIDVGVKLNVTPKISKDDFITLKIHPEVSSARRVAEVNNALAVDTTQADTTVVVKDGETIVLGGLIKDTQSKAKTQVPVLGSIPLLGHLFKSSVNTKVKKEIVVFITPHILKPGEDMGKKVQRDKAMENAFNKAKEKIPEEGKNDE